MCAMTVATFAQNASNRWGVGAGIGFTDFVNPINGQYLMFERYKGALNLNVQRYLGKSFDGRFNFLYGQAFYPYDNSQTGAQTRLANIDKGTMSYESAELWDGGLNLVYKLANGYILKEDSKFAPYLFSGIGANMINSIGVKGGAGADNTNPYIPMGLGFAYNFNPNWNLGLETQYKFALGDAYDYTTSAIRLGHNFGGGAVAPAAAAVATAAAAEALPNENWCNRGWKVGVGPTFNSFEGPVTRQNFLLDQYTTSLGVNVQKYLNKAFDARLGGSFGNVYYPNTNSTNFPGYDKNLVYYSPAQMLDLSLEGVFKFAGTLLKENAIFSPYIYAGPGANWISSIGNWNVVNGSADGAGADDINMNISTGLGFNFRTSDRFSLQLEGGRKWKLDNTFDYNQASLRGVYALGNCMSATKSTPITKEAVATTPLDSDNDGIADLTDECPYVAGKPEFFGCPDSDGDGIGDSKDKCPFEAGVASNNGCPETTPVKDADGDGIIDANDACPDKAGPASNNGCPETKTTTTTTTTTTTSTGTKGTTNTTSKVAKASYEVFFTNCNTLSSGQVETLIQIAQLLKANPNYTVEIAGNNAKGGSTACSKQIAQKLASLLRMKGVNVSNAKINAYGTSRPKYNSSQDNRAEITIFE